MVDRDLDALKERYGPVAERYAPLGGRYGPYGVLAAVVAFMFWVRMRPYDRVVTDSAVYLSGNDPWYHKRMVELAVRHFPDTTPFDPWSYFPYGTGHHSGFGGLFDQLIALAALVVGLGSPSEHTVDVVLAVAPAAFGALTAIPAYLIARRLTDRWTGLIAPVLLALLGGGILTRTLVGTADHSAAEGLFSAVAVVGFLAAVAVAYRESPMVEDFRDRNWDFLRTTLVAGGAGGLAIASYLALWSPGVMLLFTFGVFVVVQLAREHVAGRATDHLAIATVVSMLTAGVLMLLYARTYEITSGDFSLLQPLVAFGLASGTLLLLGISRHAEREGYPRSYYPPVVLGLIVAAFVLGWLVYPRSVDMLRELVTRIYSFGLLTSPTALTVQEIRPPNTQDAFRAFGAVVLFAMAGLVLLAYRVVQENRPVELLVVLWSLTMLSAYVTMIRFGYYFAISVAVLATYAIWWIGKRLLSIDVNVRHLREVELYQVIALLAILLLLVPGNVVAMGVRPPVWEQSPRFGGTDQAWYDGMNWMEENTPPVPMDYYRQYETPTDRDYAYPEGAYGVMSWWDYGHWITVMGHRIPYANPFQQNPRPASAYLQATNETRANLIMDAMPSMRFSHFRVDGMSTEELRAEVDSQSNQQAAEDGRYVVIDDQMAGGKFYAIATWAGPPQSTYFRDTTFQYQGQNVTLPATSDRYDRTMLSKLYYQDAQGLSHYRLVYEDDRYASIGGFASNNRADPLRRLPLAGNWSTISQTASQINQARRSGQLVSIGRNQFVYDAQVESRVKIYERVPGATLTGTVPDASNGTPVFALVTMETHTGRQFSYLRQTTTDADGSFSMTVSYATDNSVGPGAGGTNSSVRAVSDYAIRVGHPLFASANGTATVPESAIYGGETIEVEVTPTSQGDGSTGAENGTSAGGTTGAENETSSDGSTGTENGTSTGDSSGDGTTGSGGDSGGSTGAETVEPAAVAAKP